MHAAEGTSQRGAAWFVEPDHVNAKPPARKHARARRGDTTSTRAIVVSSLFLIFFTNALLFGGHAAIDPLLRLAATASDTRSVSQVVLPMHDGKFCRHLSFDNATAEMAEGTVEPCPDNIARDQFRMIGRGFNWGEH